MRVSFLSVFTEIQSPMEIYTFPDPRMLQAIFYSYEPARGKAELQRVGSSKHQLVIILSINAKVHMCVCCICHLYPQLQTGKDDIALDHALSFLFLTDINKETVLNSTVK